jgi:hypothetical protein
MAQADEFRRYAEDRQSKSEKEKQLLLDLAHTGCKLHCGARVWKARGDGPSLSAARP